MHHSIILRNMALLSLALFPLTSIATPTIAKRKEAPIHCVDDPIGTNKKGNLWCENLGSIPPCKRSKRSYVGDPSYRQTCGQCMGKADGFSPMKTKAGTTTCYITTDHTGKNGKQTSCPGDSAPKKNRDGSPNTKVAEAIIDAYCDVVGDSGPLGFATYAACYAFGLAQSNDDPIEDAINGMTSKWGIPARKNKC